MLDQLLSYLYAAIRRDDPVVLGLLGAYAAELDVAVEKVPQALEQAVLSSASGDWLDLWGTYFAVERAAGQDDASYLATIIAETIRPRSNAHCIENAIRDATGDEVTIDEPWRKIFVLNKSVLSGDHRIKDGVTVGRNLIQPIARADVADWGRVLAVIEKSRAAGVIVLAPLSRPGFAYSATYPGQAWRSMTWDTSETWDSIKLASGYSHSTGS